MLCNLADYCSDDRTYIFRCIHTSSVQIDDDVDSARTMSFFVYKRSNIIVNRVAGGRVSRYIGWFLSTVCLASFSGTDRARFNESEIMEGYGPNLRHSVSIPENQTLDIHACIRYSIDPLSPRVRLGQKGTTQLAWLSWTAEQCRNHHLNARTLLSSVRPITPKIHLLKSPTRRDSSKTSLNLISKWQTPKSSPT